MLPEKRFALGGICYEGFPLLEFSYHPALGAIFLQMKESEVFRGLPAMQWTWMAIPAGRSRFRRLNEVLELNAACQLCEGLSRVATWPFGFTVILASSWQDQKITLGGWVFCRWSYLRYAPRAIVVSSYS